jgi:hypothetical protein
VGLRDLLLLAIFLLAVPTLRAETVVDVSRQWGEHASSATLHEAPVGVVKSSRSIPSGVVQDTETVSSSCGCESLNTAEKLRASTYAFTGQIEEVRAVKKGRRTLVVDVDEIFKGSPKQDMEIVTEVSGGECDLSFEEGKKYLVYARWEWGSAVTSRCMGTKSIERARGDASALGPSEAMKEKLYIRLRNACMGRIDTVCCLSSLKAMRREYDVPEPENGCPEGMIPDRLRCAGSYSWCIPVTESNHRRPEATHD